LDDGIGSNVPEVLESMDSSADNMACSCHWHRRDTIVRWIRLHVCGVIESILVLRLERVGDAARPG